MTISVANTPLSWGVRSGGSESPVFIDVLDQIHETGYVGTDLGPWGYLPTDPALLRAELDARDLALAAAHVEVNLIDPQAHEAGVAQALEVGHLLKALGGDCLVLMDRVTPDAKEARQAGRVRGPRLDENELAVFAAGVQMIASAIHDQLGLRVAFHPHVGTHIEIADEVRLLLDLVSDDLVGLCLDTGHWRYAGDTVTSAVEMFGSRIWHVHLSDTDPNILQFCIDEQLTLDEAMQAGVFCPLGDGDVDFPTIIDGLRRMNYAGWVVVEQDVLLEEPDADRANALQNRDYLRRLGL